MNFRLLNEREWTAFLERCDSAVFFQTPEWYNLWKNNYALNFEARCYTLPSGKEYLLPLQKRKRIKKIVTEYLSGPVGTYGGFIGPEIPDEKDCKALKTIVQSFSLLTITQNPYNNFHLSSNVDTQHITHIISLKGIDTSDFTKNWSKNAQRKIEKAKASNFTFHDKDQEEHWKQYFDLYMDSRQRWSENASNNYPKEIFNAIFKLSPTKRKLLQLRQNGKMIYAGIFFLERSVSVAHYWNGVADSTFLDAGAAYFFQLKAIEYFSKEYDIYDLGSSGGHEGVKEFKRRIGGKPQIVHIIKQKNLLLKRLMK